MENGSRWAKHHPEPRNLGFQAFIAFIDFHEHKQQHTTTTFIMAHVHRQRALDYGDISMSSPDNGLDGISKCCSRSVQFLWHDFQKARGVPCMSSTCLPHATTNGSWIWISKDLIPASRREDLMHSCTDPSSGAEWTPGWRGLSEWQCSQSLDESQTLATLSAELC